MDVHLGSLCILAIVNSATINMGVQMSLRYTVFIYFEYILNSVARSYSSSIFNILRYLFNVFYNGYTTLYLYHQCARIFPLSNTSTCYLFFNSHLVKFIMGIISVVTMYHNFHFEKLFTVHRFPSMGK